MIKNRIMWGIEILIMLPFCVGYWASIINELQLLVIGLLVGVSAVLVSGEET